MSMPINYLKIKLFFIVAFLLHFGSIKAQDLLIKTNGEESKVKVVEIGKEFIRYKKNDNLNGPIYSISLNEVFFILYQNGSKEVFNDLSLNTSKHNQNIKIDSKIINTNDLAIVNNKYGKLVFINSKPTVKYEVLFKFKNLLAYGGLMNPDLMIRSSISNANNEADRRGIISYDALIVSESTENDIAIKFIELNKNNNISSVSKISGKYVFVGSLPLNNFRVILSEKQQMRRKIYNNVYTPINEDYVFLANKLINLGNRKKIDFDAVIYGDPELGKDLLIKF